MIFEPKTVLVCGGRHYADRDHVFFSLDALFAMYPSLTLLIHGAAPGADRIAALWAQTRKVVTRPFPADWERYGKHAAGPIRNQQMLDEGRPDLVVAFPGGEGTADMVDKAERANVRVIRVSQ